MIDRFDHLVIGARALGPAAADYETLLGVRPSWRAAASGGGAEIVMFSLGNIAIEIMAPEGAGAAGDRLRAAIDRDGEGLMSLVLHTPDIARLVRRWDQVGLAPEAPTPGESTDAQSGRTRAWMRTRAGATPGPRIFAISADAPPPLSAPAAESPVLGLDHLVIRTPAPERALAFYGAKLGLDLRLDRVIPGAGARLLMFRVGDAILEIAQDSNAAAEAPDTLWGCTWRVADAGAARARLAAAGFNVSEVRAGLKPGTRVFTVRDRTCGVPTLMLEPAPRRD